MVQCHQCTFRHLEVSGEDLQDLHQRVVSESDRLEEETQRTRQDVEREAQARLVEWSWMVVLSDDVTLQKGNLLQKTIHSFLTINEQIQVSELLWSIDLLCHASHVPRDAWRSGNYILVPSWCHRSLHRVGSTLFHCWWCLCKFTTGTSTLTGTVKKPRPLRRFDDPQIYRSGNVAFF